MLVQDGVSLVVTKSPNKRWTILCVSYVLMCARNFICRHVWICNKSSNMYPSHSNERRPCHRIWRSWSFVKLYCLCTRLQLRVVPTYYLVNSCPSRSSSDFPKFSMFRDPPIALSLHNPLPRSKISIKNRPKTSSETRLVSRWAVKALEFIMNQWSES